LAQDGLCGEQELRLSFFSSGRDSDATRPWNDGDSGFFVGLEKPNFAEFRVLSIGQTEASTVP
jgi:hypothetical protein